MIEMKARSRRLFTLFSFLIPLLLTAAGFAALGIMPFGEKTIAISDANGYYLPFLSYCRAIFCGERGLLYSFSQDIGGGIAATIWPYLLNPFSWILALFEYEQYPMAYSLGLLLMSSLYGLVMYLFLADKYGHALSCLLFSTIYALCGFNISYIFCTAFFCGGPLFLPLMAMGQRRLLRGKSPVLYAVSIGYSLVLQIQMGFAVCMASVLFFLAECWLEKGLFRRCWLRFVLASIIGGLLSAVIWIPEMMILRDGRGILSASDFGIVANAPLLDFFARFITGAGSPAQIVDGYPPVFCGILPVALTVLFFMNKEVGRRKKIAYAALLLIYTLGFYIRFFTSVFQGFTHANWFNYRFSFVFTFLMLCISMDELKRMQSIPIKRAVAAGVGILLVGLLVFFKSYEFVNGVMLLLDLALLAVMGGGFWLYKTKPEKAPQKTLILLFCLCSFLQIYLNSYFCTKKVIAVWDYDMVEYRDHIMKKEPLLHGILAADPEFYRIESEEKLLNSVGNDGMFLGYNGVGYAGHTERRFVSAGLGKLGLDFNNACWNSYDPGVPAALDSLLGIKYVMSQRDLTEEKGYVNTVEILEETLYENPYVLPVAMVSETGVTGVSLEDKNVFHNLNAVWRGLTGEERDIFLEETEICFTNHNPVDTVEMGYADVERQSEAESEENTSSSSEKEEDEHRFSSYIEFRFTAARTGPVYLYDPAAIVKDIGTGEDTLQYAGYFREGEEVVGKLYLNIMVSSQVMAETLKTLHICYADMDLLKEYSELIRNRETSISKISDSRLTGEASIEGGQRLLFTIPYDEGWTLTVDGTEVPLEKTADLFMSAVLEPGTHRYVLDYWPKGLSAGIGASILAVLGLIALSIFITARRKAWNESEEAAHSSQGETEEGPDLIGNENMIEQSSATGPDKTKKSLGSIEIKVDFKKHQRFITILCLLGLFLLMQFVFLFWIAPGKTIINFLIILPVFGLLLLLIRRNSIAFTVTALILFLVYFIDGIVYAGRLTHIRYSDLFAIKDAVRVAHRYAITFTGKTVVAFGIVLVVCGLLIFLSRKSAEKQSKKENAIIGGVILIVSLAFLVFGTLFKWIPDPTRSIDDQFDANGLVDRVGLYYAIYGQYRNSRVEMPDRYSDEKAEAVLARYPEEEDSVEPIRIIAIMNEALADYSLIGETGFNDPLVNIHDPENGFYEGKLAVSVFGGYTCNTEFEFLTGNSMQFLPNGYIPFTQLVVSDQLSLAWEMKARGMSADGIHPYYSQEWNRRRVYACLGFDRLIAGEDFSSGLSEDNTITNITDTHLTTLDFGDDLEYIRGFISDAECYRKVSEVLEESNQMPFVFAVTVQNHGGYGYDGSDFVSTDYIPGEAALNQYLTCSALSDEAFKTLIDELAQSPVKTIVLMFGDHQPGLDFTRYVEGFNGGTDYFYVPYILWSNFELASEPPSVTSANYLSAVLKACAGLPLTSWDQLRLEVMEEFPVITAYFVLNNEGELISTDEIQSSELLRDYEAAQYYRLFSANDK